MADAGHAALKGTTTPLVNGIAFGVSFSAARGAPRRKGAAHHG
jgi:hypothetical protein